MKTALEKQSKKQLIQTILEAESRAEKQEQNFQKQQEIIQKQEQNAERLKHLVKQLQRMLFGSKRERFEVDKNQMKIEFADYASEAEKQDETPVIEKITYERKKPQKHNGRNRIPDNLPVREYIIEPEGDLTGMKKNWRRAY
jgi:transposase